MQEAHWFSLPPPTSHLPTVVHHYSSFCRFSVLWYDLTTGFISLVLLLLKSEATLRPFLSSRHHKNKEAGWFEGDSHLEFNSLVQTSCKTKQCTVSWLSASNMAARRAPSIQNCASDRGLLEGFTPAPRSWTKWGRCEKHLKHLQVNLKVSGLPAATGETEMRENDLLIYIQHLDK